MPRTLGGPPDGRPPSRLQGSVDALPRAPGDGRLVLRRWTAGDGPAIDGDLGRAGHLGGPSCPDTPFDPEPVARHAGPPARAMAPARVRPLARRRALVGRDHRMDRGFPPDLHAGGRRPDRDRLDPPTAVLGQRFRYRGSDRRGQHGVRSPRYRRGHQPDPPHQRPARSPSANAWACATPATCSTPSSARTFGSTRCRAAPGAPSSSRGASPQSTSSR